MDLWWPMKLLKRVTKTANSRGNESRIAKQDSKKFPRIVETANGKLANGEGCLYYIVNKSYISNRNRIPYRIQMKEN